MRGPHRAQVPLARRGVPGVRHTRAESDVGRGVGCSSEPVDTGPHGDDPAADRMAADVGTARRRHGDRAPVEHRQHRVVTVREEVDRAGDVGPADLALPGRAQPGRVPGATGAVRGPTPVVERRRGREAGRPLGVEEVVIGAHHQHRAVEGQVAGRVGGDVAAVVGEVLALQVAHVAVAVGQQRDRRRRRRCLETEVRGADQDLTGDVVALVERQVERGTVDAFAAAAVPDQDHVRQVGGMGPAVGEPDPGSQVVADQGSPSGGSAVRVLEVERVDGVGRDRHGDVALAGEQALHVVVAEVARDRCLPRGTGPDRGRHGGARLRGVCRVRRVARLVPAVQEQHQGRGVRRVDRRHDVADHLGQLPDAGQLDRREPVVRRRGRVGAGLAGIGEQRADGRRAVRRRPVGAGPDLAPASVEHRGAEHDVVRRRVGRRRGRDDHGDRAPIGSDGCGDRRALVADPDGGVRGGDHRRRVPGQAVRVRTHRGDRPPPHLSVMGRLRHRQRRAGASRRRRRRERRRRGSCRPGRGRPNRPRARQYAGQVLASTSPMKSSGFPRCGAPYSAWDPTPSAGRGGGLRPRATCGSAGR